MLESFFKFFNQSKLNNINESNNDHLMLIGGILVETAAIDGNIDNEEIIKIKNSLINFFELSEKESNDIVNKSLEKLNESNSLYYYTSKINKHFEYNKKLELIEILWGIILSDGKIHDFESNLLRRLAGLLYISDIDCGNAKKKAVERN